jgi:hypothetical protein
VEGLIVGNVPGKAKDPAQGNGILVLSPDNAIESCDIGIGPDGKPMPNANDGVLIRDAERNVVGLAPDRDPQVKGNVISGNKANGVEITGKGATANEVTRNFIGLNIKGDGDVSNAGDGVLITAGASGNFVGIGFDQSGDLSPAGNRIGGNQGNGVHISGGATSNQVVANRIGVLSKDVSDSKPVPNGMNGVLIDGGATLNVIGGTSAGFGNVISGNRLNGVRIDGAPKTVGNFNNKVQGNVIGLADGSDAKRPNGTGGIKGSRDTAGVLILNSPSNQVGGTVAMAGTPAAPQIGQAPGNVISGNTGAGVWIEGAKSVGNLVQGNLIGTDRGGTKPELGNSGDGVAIVNGALSNWVGGAANQGNVIAANTGSGVHLFNTQNDVAGPSKNVIRGNYIGVDQGFKSAGKLGNTGDGVTIGSVLGNTLIPANYNKVGSDGPATQSVGIIYGNTGYGVNVIAGQSDSILSTSIYNNKKDGQGIRLDQEPKAKSNNEIPAPTILTVTEKGGVTTVTGTLVDLKNDPVVGNFLFQVFDHGSSTGGSYRASLVKATDAKGDFTLAFNQVFTDKIVLTVTDVKNNTSPFSDPAPVKVAQLPNAGNDAFAAVKGTELKVAAPGVLANDSAPDGDPLTDTLVKGPAHGTLTLNPDGSFTYDPAAGYTGTDTFTYQDSDGTDTSNVATVTLTVSALQTTTTVTSSANPASPGQPVTFTATVAPVSPAGGAPTGTVQFVVDGTNLGAPVPLAADGTAQSGSLSSLSPGPHTVTAVYSGDAHFDTSTGTVAQSVSPPVFIPTVTTLAATPNPVAAGQPVTFTATVASVAGDAVYGSVQFQGDGINGTVSLTPPMTPSGAPGTATFTTAAPLSPGPHTVIASYSGDGLHWGSVATITLTVNPAATPAQTATTVTSNTPTSAYGQPVTFTARVATTPALGVPSGTVDFTATSSNGTGIDLGTAMLDATGTAVLQTATLKPDTYTVVAVYQGDANDKGSTSAPITVVVLPNA